MAARWIFIKNIGRRNYVRNTQQLVMFVWQFVLRAGVILIASGRGRKPILALLFR